MKTHPQRRAGHGFTLVELLVVISIIIVLAAMSFGAANMAMNKARKVQALNDAKAIEMAIDGFFQEYSRFPAVSAGSDQIQTVGDAGVELLTVLLGKEEPGANMQNPRQIPFLTIKEGKGNKGGIIYGRGGGSATIQGLYDPWGKPYFIMMDDDFDDQIQDPIKSGQVIRNRKVVVYTLGNDDQAGTADDVKTWN